MLRPQGNACLIKQCCSSTKSAQGTVVKLVHFVFFVVPGTIYILKSTILWHITPCSKLKVNRRFGGKYRLHLQGRKISWARNQSESRWQAWRWSRYVPPKRQQTFNGLHGVICQKIALFIIIAVRTSNLTYLYRARVVRCRTLQ
jgi:hypothetical protein